MVRPTFFGYTNQQMAKFAREAMEEAVVSNAKAGITLTGLVDGRVQTLAPSDSRILAVVSKSALDSTKLGRGENS